MTITQKIEALGFSKLIGTFTNGSPEWHAARAGIGGSDVGSILGKNPYKSAYTLWAEKSNLIDGVETNDAMRLGTILEPGIRKFFAESNKDWLQVHETGSWQSLTDNWATANPDGIIEWADGQLGVLEIKHSAVFTDTLPPHWGLQVDWYLWVLGLERGVVSAVIGGRYKEFQVVRGDYLTEEELCRVVAFYDLIQSGVEPDFDGSESTYETVRTLSDELTAGDIELGNFWVDLFASKVIAEHAAEIFQKNKTVTLAYMQGIKNGTYQGDKVITLQNRNGGKPFITFK